MTTRRHKKSHTPTAPGALCVYPTELKITIIFVEWFSRCSNLRGATHTHQSQRQKFCSSSSRFSSVELTSCPATWSRHPYGLFRRRLRDTFFSMHENGALWPPIFGALEQHLLTCAHVPELIELENWRPNSSDLNPVYMLNFLWTNSVWRWSLLLL